MGDNDWLDLQLPDDGLAGKGTSLDPPLYDTRRLFSMFSGKSAGSGGVLNSTKNTGKRFVNMDEIWQDAQQKLKMEVEDNAAMEAEMMAASAADAAAHGDQKKSKNRNKQVTRSSSRHIKPPSMRRISQLSSSQSFSGSFRGSNTSISTLQTHNHSGILTPNPPSATNIQQQQQVQQVHEQQPVPHEQPEPKEGQRNTANTLNKFESYSSPLSYHSFLAKEMHSVTGGPVDLQSSNHTSVDTTTSDTTPNLAVLSDIYQLR